MQKAGNLRFRDGLLKNYGDVLTPVALEALNALAPSNDDRRALMRARMNGARSAPATASGSTFCGDGDNRAHPDCGRRRRAGRML